MTLRNIGKARRALQGGKPALVWQKIIADTQTPVGIASKLIEPKRGDFLLESVEGGKTRGRYSLIGLKPDLVFKAKGKEAWINKEWQDDSRAFRSCNTSSINALRELEQACRLDVPNELPPTLACLVGYFGFETVCLVEKVPETASSELNLPDMLFVRPTVILIFDGLTDTLYAVTPIWSAKDADLAIEKAQNTINGIFSKIAEPKERVDLSHHHLEDMNLRPVIDENHYKTMVTRAKEYINAGDVFQVVLAQRFTCPFPLPPIELYRALRRINPSPFLYFLDFPEFSLVGSSPEILVRVRDEEVTIRPIAGTRPRGNNSTQDIEHEKSLLEDPKENAEHLMLLDLGRNDVGRVATKGTVEVTESFKVERYSHVMHIVSNVQGKLDTKFDAVDAMLAGFPAGTVSGAPKIRACEIIAEIEPETRGPYAGGVGYFSPDGSLDSCIVLRTAIVKDNVMHVQAGAGIVADSNPEYELQECRAKAGALIAAAREAAAMLKQQ